jgi:hypothetical protein
VAAGASYMTTTAREHLLSQAKRSRWLLVFIEFGIAVNAVGGAVWGLAGAKNVPREWLEGTPFDSYVIPSLILLVGVGGGMTVAAVALLTRRRYAAEVTIAAGLVLVGWIATQVTIIVPNGGFSWLQPTMFAAGLLVAAFGWRLRRNVIRPQGEGS